MGLAERLAAYSPFKGVLARVVDGRVVGAALVDREGRTVGHSGEIEEDAMPLVALALYRLKSSELSDRLFTGEVLTLELEGRHVAIAIAKRQLFVVALIPEATASALACVEDLRDDIERMLHRDDVEVTAQMLRGGGGGSGSGPAALPLVEWGLTMPRAKA